MEDNIDYFLYVELPGHEPFTVMVREQTVRRSPILFKWMQDKPWDVVNKWLKKRKAKIKVVEKQYYIK